MSVKFRHYTDEPFFSMDYQKVRDFLIRINAERIVSPRFLWGAWEWGITHAGWDQERQNHIGLWEEDDQIVALATYESTLGEGFLFTDSQHTALKPELVTYARQSLHNQGKLRLLISDHDIELQRSAFAQGFRPTQDRDRLSMLDIDQLDYHPLPEGYSFVSLADDWNWHQYHRVMWRGFNHEGSPPDDEASIAVRKQMLSSPMIRPELVLAVVAADGNYVSHCGSWYRPEDTYCYIEPVATDPDYRRMGLGKAVVHEAIRRCGMLGAKQAIVGSEQPFYFSIGFFPIETMTYWSSAAKEG